MDTRILLRTARESDLPLLWALELQFPGDRMNKRQFQHHLASPRSFLRVATGGGRVLGYHLVLVRKFSRWARLYSLAVAHSERGQGIGRKLLADAEQKARTAGRRGLRLEVRQDNVQAIRLYETAGFRRVKALPGYYDDGADGWRYERRWDGG